MKKKIKPIFLLIIIEFTKIKNNKNNSGKPGIVETGDSYQLFINMDFLKISVN